MRADRLLSIIWLLRAHGQLQVGELATRLDVSRRTVLRDIEALSTAGVPVYCERGPRGGVRLMPGFRMDVTALNEAESRALFAAVTTWGAHELGLGEALASGLRKLLAAVPEQHRPSAAEVAGRIVIDPQGWLPEPERHRRAELLRIVQEAVFAGRRLRIRYSGRGTATPRSSTVDPHGLLSSGGVWYLCASRDRKVRFYRLSRLADAEMLPEPCPSGPAVDVAAQWEHSRTAFQQRFVPVHVVAWVHSRHARDLHEWAIAATQLDPEPDTERYPGLDHELDTGLGPDLDTGPGPEPTLGSISDPTPGHTPPPDDAPLPSPPDADGHWLRYHLTFVDHEHAMAVLLRLGADAQIIGPTSIRDDLLTHCAALIARYR